MVRIPRPDASLDHRLGSPGFKLDELLRALIEAVEDVQEMYAVDVDPAPTADSLQVFVRTFAGRRLLTVQTPAGRTYQLQPSFFGNFVGSIQANRTTSLTNIGLTHSTVGTVSHPVSVTLDYQVYGRMANFATIAATIAGKAGVISADAMFFRGTVPGFGGWWSSMRVGTPSIDQVRLVAGLTNGSTTTAFTLATSLHQAVFFYDTELGHTNWQFWTKGGTAAGTIVDTGIPLRVGGVYDMFTRCKPNDGEIGWEIIDADTGQSASGTVDTLLPTATVLMRTLLLATTLEPAGATRSVRMQRIYIESDR